MAKYFVWVSGLRGPEAQLWDSLTKTKELKPIASTPPIRLLDNDERSIFQLEQKFSYERCLALDKNKAGEAVIK